jgi:crotonobetainyl-CoA:carnitine CoA-transferase CaiB-like acyl-CoA transferase
MLDRITDDIDRLEILGAELDKELAKYTRDELVKKALDYSAKASRDRLRAKGFPIIVKTLTPSEVLKEQHWKVRNTLIEVNHPTHGKFILPASVPKMSKTPPRIKQIKCGIGEDNEFIYKKYGLRT